MFLIAKLLVCRRGVPIAWIVVREGEFSSRKYKSRNDVEEQLIEWLRDVFKGYR